LHPSYSYKSKIYFEDNNDEKLTQEAYGLLNFTAGMEIRPQKVQENRSLRQEHLEQTIHN
jgi:hypothetical protein